MLNKVMLIANLTRDPDARSTTSGTSVVNLGLAVNRKWKDKDGNQKEDTVFVDCDVWGKSADFCRDYLRKGNKVFIDGRLKMDTWEDRNTGDKRSKLGIVAESVQNLSPRSNSDQQEQQPYQQPQGQQQAQHQSQPPPAFPGDESVDDIPY